jgi:tetratricopeptide (TPR) repeat protein
VSGDREEARWRGLAEVAREERSLGSWLGLGATQLASLVSLALAKMRVGRNAEAVRIMRGALALEPKCVPLHVHLGIALERSGELEAAIRVYDAAIALSAEGELAEALVLRAGARTKRGDLEGARADLERARSFALEPAWQHKAAQIARIARVAGGGG